jgi:cation diffusion facilitator family transporter
MQISLAVGILMLAGKLTAYALTGSAAILSDAAESVVHVVAVGFAAFSLWLNARPANHRFLYGYERISFFSAGFEGALIVLAALFIIVESVRKWLAGLEIERLGLGTILVAAAACINALLGWYLVRTGRKAGSLILEANGRHVLTDAWTSFGVVAGLCLVLLTGWMPFDPLLAIAVAVNILWSGGKLIFKSVGGLMDYSDPGTGNQLREVLDRLCPESGCIYHDLRYRDTGHRLIIEMHLLFPYETSLGEAHRQATLLERRLIEELRTPAEVITHLESLEDHAEVHRSA